MGTSALTKVLDKDGAVLVSMYRQFDGYQDVHGAELRDFLKPLKLVNGFSDRSEPIANGMGCLAAFIVANFKVEVGGFYLCNTQKDQDYLDYIYEVYPLNSSDNSPICIKCKCGFDGTVYYDGLVSEYEAVDKCDDDE